MVALHKEAGDILPLLKSAMQTVSTGKRQMSGCLDPRYPEAGLIKCGLTSQREERVQSLFT